MYLEHGKVPSGCASPEPEPMLLIEELGFPLAHELKLVALQGNCGLREELTAGGGKYVVVGADRAREACLNLIERAQAANAHLALIPEMVIPQQAIADLIETLGRTQHPLILIGGVEGIVPSEYRALVAQYGGTPDVPDDAAGTYVNAMLVALRTATDLKVFFRAKRFASGPENAGGPQLALGLGEFLVLKLGSAPFAVVPLICSELVWPDLWNTLADETAGLQIDVMPVLQRNHDTERRHWGPVVHTAYQRNAQTRFVLVNQGLSPRLSDGTCFVIAPPSSPAAPGFDHGRNELWLPDNSTYKGFRIPERTGCFWYADISHRNGPMNATRPPVCGGKVLAVLTPTGVDLAGLSAGLMRSVAAERYLATSAPSWSSNDVKRAYRSSLNGADRAYVLDGASSTTASDSFFGMICDARPTWGTVESLVGGLVEATALLACGGDTVRIAPWQGGNCSVSGRSVAILYAPSIDVALSTRFSTAELLSGAALPTGIVLLEVEAASRNPKAKTVGDVLRADRVSTESPELNDGPKRVPRSSVTIGLGDIHFCEPKELRPNLDEATLILARNRTSALLPGVYA